jgi:hypothetical protein
LLKKLQPVIYRKINAIRAKKKEENSSTKGTQCIKRYKIEGKISMRHIRKEGRIRIF